jgi:hypothetical protein
VAVILGNQAYLYKNNLSEKEQRVLLFPSVNCTRSDGAYPSLGSVIQGMQTFNTAMEQKAKENDVDFVNLENILPKSLEYFTDDVHYTEKGNSIVAKTLFNSIVQGGYIQ